jgi:hypothetical protein
MFGHMQQPFHGAGHVQQPFHGAVPSIPQLRSRIQSGGEQLSSPRWS